MMDDHSDANMIKNIIKRPNVVRDMKERVIRIVFKFFYRPVSICKE